MKRYIPFLLIIATLSLTTACTDLRNDQPIRPVADLEAYLVGDLSASFVGTENCLKACHAHDKLRKDMDLSIHGQQVTDSGLPLVNCESCHGPGSTAVENARENKICDFNTLFPLKEFPAQARALICIKCHSAASTPNLQFWNASSHANGDVSCFDCHKLHLGPAQKVSRSEMDDLCYGCHQSTQAEFAQTSHHPIPEGEMSCADCHNPHGTANDNLLEGATIKDMCTRCHMAQQGPFVFEHADVTEDCSNCHSAHGSPNRKLLTVSEPFLCMQCHPGHHSSNMPTLDSGNRQAAFYSRCTDCHSAIHGTDIPSSQGRGTFLAR